jgi:uncharacterized protein YcnI
MRFPSLAPKRAIITAASTSVVLSIGLTSGTAPACAHVRVDADDPAPGSTSVVTIRVPGESENGALTTKLSVELPEGDSVTFPATQTYSDGTVVRWDQAPLPGGGEPAYPAPVLSLTGPASEENHEMHATAAQTAPTATADNTARWLAGGAIILAAVGLAAALISRRRT